MCVSPCAKGFPALPSLLLVSGPGSGSRAPTVQAPDRAPVKRSVRGSVSPFPGNLRSGLGSLHGFHASQWAHWRAWGELVKEPGDVSWKAWEPGAGQCRGARAV